LKYFGYLNAGKRGIPNMLDGLNDLIEVVRVNPDMLGSPWHDFNWRHRAGDMYCPNCGDFRKMDVANLNSARSEVNLVADIAEQIIPAVFYYSCAQCATRFTAIVYRGPEGSSLAVLPSCHGGLTTPNTPKGVAYYLDQANRAQSVGASSGSVAMFRGALEHLLFEQGYQTGMLGAKLNQLEENIKRGTAPKWAMEIDTDFLQVMKDLGNASIHPNDGNVEKQKLLDSELIAKMKSTFNLLLFLVYELPSKKDSILQELRARAGMIKK
jgi:hypothetical protein